MLQVNQITVQRQAQQFSYQLQAKAGELVAIVGPSGSGKSTLLEALAGFTNLSAGSIYWQQQQLNSLPPAQRPLTCLFQQHNLFHHLSLRQNLALGLSAGKGLSQEQTQQLEQVAASLNIAELLERLPGEVSGGQQQRAALARCVLRHQPILLLDEPFSALDPILRQDCLQLVKQLASERQILVIMVTHHWKDAEVIADQVVFLHEGKVVQQGSPESLARQPQSDLVKQFIAFS